MTERRRAPIEVLERLADAVDREFNGERATADVREWLSAYRAATAPLRSRADVDAEIATVVRTLSPEMLRRAGYSTLVDLCSESTAPEPEPDLLIIDCPVHRGVVAHRL